MAGVRFLLGVMARSNMIRNALFTVSLFLVHTLSCNAPLVRSPDALAAIPEDTLITLERRGVCDGICPSYKLTIRADVSAIYEGKRSAKTEGLVESKISKERLHQLVSEFESIGFFSLRDSYAEGAEDCTLISDHGDSVTTSLRVNGRVKEVIHWSSCKRVGSYSKLADLENRIDETVAVKTMGVLIDVRNLTTRWTGAAVACFLK